MTVDGRLILAAQALRAFVYGFAAVLLGVTLDARGWSTGRVGVLLAAILAGAAVASLGCARLAGRVGRRRSYACLFVGLAATGVAFALTSNFAVLVVVALAGLLSTDVVESGPFSSLEQAMLPETVPEEARTRTFGTYNAVATVSGSLGALAAGGPQLLRDAGWGVADQRLFLVMVPVGVVGTVLAASLSPAVEGPIATHRTARLDRSRPTVLRLSALFAVDSFGGGFAVQSFLVFLLSRKFGISAGELSVVFFAVGFLQAGSFLVATRLAERFGLLRTMVWTHLPSNLLLTAIAFAPNGTVAIVLLLGRFALSQMDVPTRLAYVTALVDPDERVPAAAYTSTARYVVRPISPMLGGLLQHVALGAPLVAAGAVKTTYDLALWAWFRHVPLPALTNKESDDLLPANCPGPAPATPRVPVMGR
jgi:MFS family permease